MNEIDKTALYRHVKRGSLYSIVGIGMMQATGNELDEADVVIYRGVDDGRLFARPVAQFLDGRFEKVEAVKMPAHALDALTEVRDSLRFANENPGGGINDTIWMMHRPETVFDALDDAIRLVAELTIDHAKLHELVNSPELHDFSKAIVLEAAHQRDRWGTDHDAGKTSGDWFWLIGHLASKALCSVSEAERIAKAIETAHTPALLAHLRADLARAREKALHHVITAAAALNNWHASLTGANTRMRPGIEGKPA